jgi:hypothetical protein
VADVSGRLKDIAEVGRNMKGYFTIAFTHCVRNHVFRESRIEYEGLIREENHYPHAPDWIRGFEAALSLKLLAAYMPAPAAHAELPIVGVFLEIGVVFNMTEQQVRPRTTPVLRVGRNSPAAIFDYRPRHKDVELMLYVSLGQPTSAFLQLLCIARKLDRRILAGPRGPQPMASQSP